MMLKADLPLIELLQKKQRYLNNGIKSEINQ